MKKTVMILLALVVSTATAVAVESPWEKKLPFKTATIDYTITGTQNGTKTLYVKDYGRTVAEYRHTTMTAFGMDQIEETIDITTPDWEYTIDLSESTGTKMVNPEKYLTEEFHRLSESDQKKVIKTSDELGVNTADGMAAEIKKNNTKILGYMCDKTSMMGMTVFTISGTSVPLKLESDMMGMKMNETATSIKTGPVPSSKFDIPSGINLQHDEKADQMAKMQAKNIIQSLLKGEMPAGSMEGYGDQLGDEESGEYNDDGQGDLSPEQIQQMKQMMQKFGGQKE